MPTYDYQCKRCGAKKEKNVKITDRDNVVICECGYIMCRNVGSPNFNLKGSGWFKDGYQNSLK